MGPLRSSIKICKPQQSRKRRKCPQPGTRRLPGQTGKNHGRHQLTVETGPFPRWRERPRTTALATAAGRCLGGARRPAQGPRRRLRAGALGTPSAGLGVCVSVQIRPLL